MAKRKKKDVRHRYPTPEEMDILDALLDMHGQAKVKDPDWRKMRQMACRMKYEEREGKIHPAWEGTDEIDPMTHDEFLDVIAPPPGMLWQEFGRKWDLAPYANDDGDYEVIFRHADMHGQWRGRLMQTASPLEMQLISDPSPIQGN
jgi:hypothetical protein